jgi:hypothetical protein
MSRVKNTGGFATGGYSKSCDRCKKLNNVHLKRIFKCGKVYGFVFLYEGYRNMKGLQT